MSWMLGFTVFRQLYPFFRPQLKKAIDDPDHTWDDVLMGMLDGALGASHNTVIEPEAVMMVLKQIYGFMRPVLAKAIDDPESEWDEFAMTIMDDLFDFPMKETV